MENESKNRFIMRAPCWGRERKEFHPYFGLCCMFLGQWQFLLHMLLSRFMLQIKNDRGRLLKSETPGRSMQVNSDMCYNLMLANNSSCSSQYCLQFNSSWLSPACLSLSILIPKFPFLSFHISYVMYYSSCLILCSPPSSDS